MSAEEYPAMVRRWAADLGAQVDYSRVRNLIEFLAENLFDEYKPTKWAGEKRFLFRFSDWLNNATDENDRKVLFELVPQIMFVGVHEFDSLYQAAFDGPIARWLIDQIGLKADGKGTQGKLKTAVNETWFCAITDSMQIAEFYHLNRIQGVDVRPVWRTLYALRSDDTATKIDEYMQKHKFKRIVLLEDFVGSGTQMASAVKFAATLPSNPSLLLCPMIICPKGGDQARNLGKKFPNVTYKPVLELPKSSCLSRLATAGEDDFMIRLRATAISLNGLLRSPLSRYPAFGFKNTGALVVMHTNCPNNTLPIVHHASHDGSPWSPLFPRSERT